ncbi:HNH endonuclease [Pelagibacterium luteolum]|uniref:HNH endonuclease n=1 Tax=Pelagibacterium luteolum TaxID=440168 RepID=A0A1G7TJ96_9HYPH|nr:HNH endonuclease [Pelagibacterium luteolum]SDG35172.1 HNH endonuclease [Pelagibacterium luteolum]
MSVGLSKKLRFDVFKRDGFQCQYCGAHPSESMVLEVDHIVPVCEGGGNEIDNLVTACFDCNRGKAGTPLSVIPISLAEKADLVLEQEAQIKAYYAILEARKERKDAEIWSIADIFSSRHGDDGITRSRFASIRMFLDRLDYYDVTEAMEIATDKAYGRERMFAYFCGICWRKIKGGDE